MTEQNNRSVKLQDPYNSERSLRRIFVRRIDLDQYIEKSRTPFRNWFAESSKQSEPKTIKVKRKKQEEKRGRD